MNSAVVAIINYIVTNITTTAVNTIAFVARIMAVVTNFK